MHRPQIIFLDEPTTGLDPQSRSALWDEVSRLAKQEGATVLLTTQSLEEADALADRVGIIDHGQIVAEDTPEALKAEIGHSSIEASPADLGDLEALSRLLEGFGEPIPVDSGAAAVRLKDGTGGLAEIVRALDKEGLSVSSIQLNDPTLDDVYLEKTGRSLEGQGDSDTSSTEERR